jgi:anti-sigma regulatory factor (Ser/Thr protein kinase)
MEQARLKLKVENDVTSRVRTFTAGFAAKHRLSKDDCARALIVLEELLTNLVKFGYRDRARTGKAEVVLLLDEESLTVELHDDGAAFDPFAVPEPDFGQPLESRPIGGLGLHIVRLLTEGRDYNRVNDRNVTRLTLSLSPKNTQG